MRAEDRMLESMGSETEEERYYQREQLREEYFAYLDELRESGITNMCGARPYLVDEFGLSKKEAGSILTEWMQTFSRRHPER